MKKPQGKKRDVWEAIMEVNSFIEPAEDDVSKNEKIDEFNQAVDFLRNSIDKVLSYLRDEDPGKRLDIVNCLARMRDPRSIEPLLKVIIEDRDEDVCKRARDILSLVDEEAEIVIKEEKPLWIDNDTTRKRIKDLLRGVKGIKLFYLLEITREFSDQGFIFEVLEILGRKPCRVIGGFCNKNIKPEPQKYFIAYAFKKKKTKETIEEALKAKFPQYESLTADANQIIRDLQIFCNICQKIQATKFGVYDLSRSKENILPNPNVMLELGIAYGFGKPVILLVKKGTRFPSDIGGALRIEYRDYSDLKRQIEKGPDFSKLIESV